MERPQYGIDAPDLLRLFFIAGTCTLTIFIVILFSSIFERNIKIILSLLFGIVATYLFGMGIFMFYGSKIMKVKDRDKLLNFVDWSGDELVLDIGCGRGLMLIGAAKRLTYGRAIGIDIWQQEDQANNSADAVLLNSKIENVAERVQIQTADMRQLPFSENYFDVVTSSWAIHNLEAEADRQKTLDEIIRVLKPNGKAIITDITYQLEYVRYFESCGMKNIQLINNPIRDLILKIVTFGSFAPSALLVQK